MKDKIEQIKFIIGRYDTYIESTQTKSNLYLALNTAILGGIITLLAALKIEDIGTAIIIILGFIALLCLISITFTLLAITPYLKSVSKKSNSVVFFQDVSEMVYDEYYEKIEKISDSKMYKDLTCQSYSLAKGLKAKYNKLMYAGRIIILEFLCLFICVILLISKIL
jgi:hypothetical protein